MKSPMALLDLAVIGGRLVSPDGVYPADIGISAGHVAVITEPGLLPPAHEIIDARGDYILPGLVDPHTHPGNFRPLAQDIASETRSAAVGGVTTLLGTVKVTRMGYQTHEISHPEDVVSYLEVFETGRQIANTKAHVDVAYSFVIMTRQQAEEIPAYVRECGVRSFKFFLLYPPTSEWGAWVGMPVFPDEGTVFLGFKRCAEVGALAMVHAENSQVIQALGSEFVAGREGLEAWEAHFPGLLEASEVRKAAFFARAVGAHYYAVHLSSAESLAAIEHARAEGTIITAETCPQYLVLTLESHAGLGPLGKFNPPIRRRIDAEALWQALQRGTIQCLGSDHVPNLRARKIPDGSMERALPGSPGVATLLPLLWTFGVAAGRLTPERLVELCCRGPAQAFGLYPRKGALLPGSDADLVIVEPEHRWTVDPVHLHSWADFSAYEGMELVGWPRLTLLRGQVVARDGQPVGPPIGRYLAR
ncbi:MAG TPA: amidohydrolase family protein [Chloroflexota bacterium]|nr:amidohydrolase family protein [Chloroflexota bacterium]